MKRFLRDENGFVLVFGLLVLPIFLAFGLLIIDAGRGNNAHADLQAAADAVALAGARELNSGPDAITRAQAAMANLTNSVNMLGLVAPDTHIPLVYAATPGNEFSVAFLTSIPNFDTTPITQTWINSNTAATGDEAAFVYVKAQSKDLQTAFLNPVTLLQASVPVAAVAVATYVSAVCDTPPLYICNPFEYVWDPVTSTWVYDGNNLQDHFQAGDLYGRLIRLHPPGSTTNAPGNFGFLDQGNGAKALNDLFAGEPSGTCYSATTVDTETGAMNNLAQGINTRLDMYAGPYANPGNVGFPLIPPENSRKGLLPDAKLTGGTVTINDCVSNGAGGGHIVDDHVMDLTTGVFNADGIDENAYGLPDNYVMILPGKGGLGAAIGQDDTWPITTYLDENYGPGTVPVSAITPTFAGKTPSRYDVYKYELANAASLNLNRSPGDQVGGVDTGEMGYPMCGQSKGLSPSAAIPDRRVLVAAIIDCGSQAPSPTGKSTLTVNSYGSFFLARPMVQYSPSTDMTIDVEVIDITGYGGNGTLETYLREEAVLVR